MQKILYESDSIKRRHPERIPIKAPEAMTDSTASFHRPNTPTEDVAVAFAKLGGAFPTLANFQGLHFKYAVRDGVVLIESKRDGRYFYWMLVGDKFLLIHASLQSKLKRMQTITNATFTPSTSYNHAPDA